MRSPHPPRQMAPGQPSYQSPWRDIHPFFLLSPLMGLLSWAWSQLSDPEPLEPWLVEGVKSAGQGEAGLEGEGKAALATHCAPWGSCPQREARDSGTAVEDGESSWEACPNLKANSSLLEALGLSDDNDKDCGGEEASSIPEEWISEYIDDQPAPLSPGLSRTLEDQPGKEESKKGGVAENKVVTFFSFPPSHWECCPEVEEEDDGEAIIGKTPHTSTSPLSPGSMPRVCMYCTGEEEEEARAKEKERTENKEAKKTSIFSSSAVSNPRAWESYSGEESQEEKDGNAETGEADPEPYSSVTAQRHLLRTWQHRPNKITQEDEEEEKEEEDSASEKAEGLSTILPMSAFIKTWMHWPGEDTEEKDEDSDSVADEEEEAEGPSFNPSTSTFLRAWVFKPGEETEEEEEEEEEEEDNDSGTAEEDGEAEGPSSILPTSAFVRSWVYRPGEETEEDSDSGTAEEDGEAEGPSSILPTSAFLRDWVYRPGEDTEEEDESESAGSGPNSSLQTQIALLRGWTNPPGKETERQEVAEEWGEVESRPFRVVIYLPGEKPPLPWPLPQLPLRLQRRLKFAETPTQHLDTAELPIQHLDPETPQKARKVRFSEKISIHFLVVWAEPAKAARRGPWEQFARDRSRFARRIAQAEEELGPCLTPAARARAWARLGNPPLSLAATTQPLPTSSVQAMPLNNTVASPSPLYVSVSPCLDLSGKCG